MMNDYMIPEDTYLISKVSPFEVNVSLYYDKNGPAIAAYPGEKPTHDVLFTGIEMFSDKPISIPVMYLMANVITENILSNIQRDLIDTENAIQTYRMADDFPDNMADYELMVISAQALLQQEKDTNDK